MLKTNCFGTQDASEEFPTLDKPADFVFFDYSEIQYAVQSALSALDEKHTQTSESYTEEDLRNTTRCATCKGACCKRMACHYSPEDFKEISFKTLKALIDEGRISIDWFDRSEEPLRGYYLRARHLNSSVVEPAFGGRCVNLTSTGCSLDWEHRPKGGRYLQAGDSEHSSCVNRYSKAQCSLDWLPYWDILSQLVDHYGDADEPDYLSYLKYQSGYNLIYGG